MKVTCEYCGSHYEDTQGSCPNCGAPNPRRVEDRPGGGEPRTIEELAAWYQAHNLPPYETTRFFIGIDCAEPRAFGIYRKPSTGDVVVYKNKADGTRAVRYEGRDEAYAVNELLTKLKDEVLRQKVHAGQGGARHAAPRGVAAAVRHTVVAFLVAMLVVGALLIVASFASGRHDGYYAYDDAVYYRDDDVWFRYYDHGADADGTWLRTWYVPDGFEDDPDAYYVSGTWDSSLTSDYDVTEPVEDSASYELYSSETDDSDDDYSWDSDDSWDAGTTDWDSDW